MDVSWSEEFAMDDCEENANYFLEILEESAGAEIIKPTIVRMYEDAEVMMYWRFNDVYIDVGVDVYDKYNFYAKIGDKEFSGDDIFTNIPLNAEILNSIKK